MRESLNDIFDPNTFEFRDGERTVPRHVAALFEIAGIDTVRYTFEEALRLANDGLMNRHLRTAHDRVIDEHMKAIR